MLKCRTHGGTVQAIFVGALDKTHRRSREGAPRGLRGGVSAFGSGHDLGSWDGVLHWAPCMEPASPSAWVSASVCLS